MGKYFYRIKFLAYCLFHLIGSISNAHIQIDPLEPWLIFQTNESKINLFKNISPEGTVPGFIAAALSKSEPDYFYHWVRDASLVMSIIVDMYKGESDPERKLFLYQKIVDFESFSRKNQYTPVWSGGPNYPQGGEVLYDKYGSPRPAIWGRPQNDGPALRAISLIKFANILLLQPDELEYVKTKLTSTVNHDLDYVETHWREKSYDIWEESLANHFYTRMVQRKALVDGIQLATTLGDSVAAQRYLEQKSLLEIEILKHWDEKKGYIQASLDGGDDYFFKLKKSNLDIAVILATLHAPTEDDFFSVTSDEILATATKLIETFRPLYKINEVHFDKDGLPMAEAIGRYFEDLFNGVDRGTTGNPWILATNAMAELAYRARENWLLPDAKSGLFTGVILETGRAVGETMAVLMVCGNVVETPRGVFDPIRTLTANIALEMSFALGDHRSALFVSGLLLMALVVALAVAAEVIGKERIYG